MKYIFLLFLNTPLPDDWDIWTLEQRKWYWRCDFPYGKCHRQHICALEIWQEYFNRDYDDFTRTDAGRINAILRELPYWKETTVNCGPLYGVCRGFQWDGLSELYDRLLVEKG